VRVLVVGSGPMAARHAANVVALGHEPVAVPRLEDAGDARVDAVVAATPPVAHLDALAWAVERRLPVLLEKPLAVSSAGLREALARAAAARVHATVGYNLRFHPALRSLADAVAAGRIGRLLSVRLEVGSFLPSWHPELDWRRGSAARGELGGGALPTLSHELDLALWIGGDAQLAGAIAARSSSLGLDVEDVGELLLRHASGAVGSIHCDLVDRAYNRRSRWIGEEATLEWSWGGPLVRSDGSRAETLWEDARFDLEQTYVDELRAFLAGEPAPGDDALADAARVVELLEEARA
jgi:predicted dehydrogenase